MDSAISIVHRCLRNTSGEAASALGYTVTADAQSYDICKNTGLIEPLRLVGEYTRKCLAFDGNGYSSCKVHVIVNSSLIDKVFQAIPKKRNRQEINLVITFDAAVCGGRDSVLHTIAQLPDGFPLLLRMLNAHRLICAAHTDTYYFCEVNLSNDTLL
ncbi:hypothetical protein AVEN_135960-1 [Araneus ventricosus]|uniref:Uncharacterized protein n=1 Tax=Araneus ventricosus TaxID=182803 RepID=A0A4Y2L827_ARAVE|nr:hypothetical protein AVEN_135960-1 [Araneus ventricosus]